MKVIFKDNETELITRKLDALPERSDLIYIDYGHGHQLFIVLGKSWIFEVNPGEYYVIVEVAKRD